MTWALTRPFAEVETYMARFEASLAANPGLERPRFMTMRHTAIYEKPETRGVYLDAVRNQGRQFENLFRKLAPVVDGFAQAPDPALLTNQAEYEPSNLLDNLIFGSPDEAIAKLKLYAALDVDYFCYQASYGLPLAEQETLAPPLRRRGHARLPGNPGQERRGPLAARRDRPLHRQDGLDNRGRRPNRRANPRPGPWVARCGTGKWRR